MSLTHRLLRASTSSLFKPPWRSLHAPLRGLATVVVPKQRSVLLRAPSKEQLDELGIDEDVVDESEACVVISDRAAEHLRKIATREKDPEVALRVAVESGGCHGYQYKVNLTSDHAHDDYLFAHPSTQPSNVLVDATSMALVNGSTIDFATELIGSSFRVSENPQAKGNGCGCGVSWEAKI